MHTQKPIHTEHTHVVERDVQKVHERNSTSPGSQRADLFVVVVHIVVEKAHNSGLG